MILGQVERYTISQAPEGLVITMRQRKGAVACMVFALGVVALLIWKIGPPFQLRGRDQTVWLFYVGAGLLAVLSVIGACYRERWVFSRTEIRRADSFNRISKRVFPGRAVKLHIFVKPGSGEGRPILPYQIDVLDAGGQNSGLKFEFTASRQVDQFLHLLRIGLSLEIEDARVNHGSV